MRDDVVDSGIVGAWVPECDDHGFFNSKQCNYSARTCWCVKVNGEMVDGTSEFFPDPSKLSDKKCAHNHDDRETESDKDDDEWHNQGGLQIWDFNIKELLSHYGKDKLLSFYNKLKGEKIFDASMNHANINFAPQNTNIQNFVNINTQIGAEFKYDGKPVDFSWILLKMANHSEKEKAVDEFFDCIKKLGVDHMAQEILPAIREMAASYGIDGECFDAIEQSFEKSVQTEMEKLF